jgi:hypothetical protein
MFGLNFFHWFIPKGPWYLVCEENECTYLYSVHNWHVKQNIWDKKFSCTTNPIAWYMHATTTFHLCKINLICQLPTFIYIIIIITTNDTNKHNT